MYLTRTKSLNRNNRESFRSLSIFRLLISTIETLSFPFLVQRRAPPLSFFFSKTKMAFSTERISPPSISFLRPFLDVSIFFSFFFIYRECKREVLTLISEFPSRILISFFSLAKEAIYFIKYISTLKAVAVVFLGVVCNSNQ